MPERFDVIARNFYWLNVTRFYAGCFSRGELASLVDLLSDLVEADGYRYISYPRKLCRMLLGDWVFSQQPKIVLEVMNLMINKNGLRLLMISHSPLQGGMELIQLPERCGRRALMERCFDELAHTDHPDYRFWLCRVIEANTSTDERMDHWLSRWGQIGSDPLRMRWLRTGSALYVFNNPATVDRVLEDVARDTGAIKLVLRGGGQKYFERDQGWFRLAYDIVMNDESLQSVSLHDGGSVLGFLRVALDPRTYLVGPRALERLSVAQVMERYYGVDVDPGRLPNIAGAEGRRLDELIRVIWEEWQRPATDWRRSAEPWNWIVEPARRAGGRHWQILCLANVGAGAVVPLSAADKRYGDLFDDDMPLCERIRTARRTRALAWWQACLSAGDEWQSKMGLAVALSWGPPRVLRGVQGLLDERLEGLDTEFLGASV